MRYVLEGPAVLLSSSFDLREARIEIEARIAGEMQRRGSLIRPFRWEEETDGGARLDARSPVQHQIDEMLDGRIALTVVMFGERIGEPMRGELPPVTEKLLAAWEKDGLVHPWPEQADTQAELLASGKFPLTGTVYELLVGLDQATPGDIIVGYVADPEIQTGSKPTDISFNNRALYRAEAPADPLSPETERYKAARYVPQVHALLNLLKVLTVRRGLPIRRFTTARGMVEGLAMRAAELLEDTMPDRTGQLPFKSSMEHYRFDDPLPLPDRRILRRELKEHLLAYGRRGEVLLLEGPSGCGKSSLLQKGVLDNLQEVIHEARIVVFRPMDLGSREERTPFLRLTGLIADTLDMAGLQGLRAPGGADGTALASGAASTLQTALEHAGIRLVLAIDQFEDVIDLADIEFARRDTAGSWWQVLRFLGAAAREERIFVVGTLESLRKEVIDQLDLPSNAGLTSRTENADFPIGEVRRFVSETAAFARLPLSGELVEDIRRMVEDFERARNQQGDATASASFLPLLSIWLYRLFATFQDRMGSAGSTMSADFGGTTNELTAADLKERGIELELGQLIGEMVQDAWDEAGQLEQHEVDQVPRIVDRDKLSASITSMLDNEKTARFARTFFGSQGFDITRFWLAMGRDVAGIEPQPVMASRPNENTMENFLGGLVTVDSGSKMRLTDMPSTSTIDSIERLIAAHRKRRLLVPAGAGKLRLVHQAVLDNWVPGRQWFARSVGTLMRVRRMGRVAEDDEQGFRSLQQSVAADVELLPDAVRILAHKRGSWGMMDAKELNERDRRAKAACLAILSDAPDGSMSVQTSGDRTTTVAHQAATYDLAAALDRWLAGNPGLVDLRDHPAGETPLLKATWSAANAVRVLLKHGARANEPSADEWRPICAPIQTGRLDIFDQLIGAYGGGSDVVGPAGITMLHEAARARNPEILRRLLASADPIDVRTENHQTPLHFAAMSGGMEHVRLLLGRCEPKAVDIYGHTALHDAAMNDHGQLIAALLAHENLSKADRAALLTGSGITAVDPLTPLALAAVCAKPRALAELLLHCDPSDACHKPGAIHAIVQVTMHNARSKGGAPLADRVSECVRILLADDRLSAKDAATARQSADDFPDARRLIDEWLIARQDFEDVPRKDLLGWLVGSRGTAPVTVLTKVPGILDMADDQGKTGAMLLVQQGQASTVAAALAFGIEPSRDAELFRLEAALRLLRDGTSLPDDPAKSLHPLIGTLVSGQAEAEKSALLSAARGNGSRSILHRLALRNEIAAFHLVLSGMSDPVPLDSYGRPPSALASPSRRASFVAIETSNAGAIQ